MNENDFIRIDTIPVDVLHITCMATSREELLNAFVEQARRYFGDEIEFKWTEARIKYVGSNVDTWSGECWCMPANEGPFISVKAPKEPAGKDLAAWIESGE